MNRREFLKNACAAAAACGLPARIWGAAKMMDAPDLVIGLLSDIHIQLPPTVERAGALERFRHALEYFRDRHVDGVLVSGDLANAGLETELAAVAETWFSVFPDGKLPDGSPVANLMHYGDHDAEARFYNDKLKAKLAAGGEIRFVVRPANCWGVADRPCSSVWNGSRVSLNVLTEERRVG